MHYLAEGFRNEKKAEKGWQRAMDTERKIQFLMIDHHQQNHRPIKIERIPWINCQRLQIQCHR